jgi:hypothetical protein
VKENNLSPRIQYPAKLSFKISGGKNIFHNKQKLKQYMTTKPPLQKILKGILHTEDKNKTMKGQKVLNLMRRTNKYSESSIESLHTINFLNNKNN